MLSSALQATCPFCFSMKLLRDCGCKYSDVARRHTIVVARGWFLADGGQYPKRGTPIAAATPSPAEEAPVTRDAAVKVDRPAKVIDQLREVVASVVGRASKKYAPPGQCTFCDRMRKNEADRVARHRAKNAPKDG